MSATAAATRTLSSTEIAFAYHTRTKHSLERYAPGPETLDWDAQPNPFREFAGAPRTELPLAGSDIEARFADIYAPGAIPAAPLTIETGGALMQLAMGLTAWKEYGPDRWALRCNPSSGNLHPTEAYVFARGVSGLGDGTYHYLSRDHVLEQRCVRSAGAGAPALWIGLSSVHWREAWKYGERAFRYCQLDLGHALGAIRYAAGALGWRASVIEGLEHDTLAALMGIDRPEDFGRAEREDADILIAIDTGPSEGSSDAMGSCDALRAGDGQWTGAANVLDAHPMYRWPIIDEVSEATKGCGAGESCEPTSYPSLAPSADGRAVDIILGRRSAQRFDAKTSMSVESFHHILDCLLARPIAPWDVWRFTPRLHPFFFVHRVEGLEPGLYALPRNRQAEQSLRAALREDFEWKSPAGTPAHLPFFRLLPANTMAIAKTISCHQSIASDGCFALSMLSEFEPLVQQNPWRYRQLYWEAGLLGHVLYLEAEAAGLRGTGIGCYFDDALHSLLGLTDRRLQALYHFTVGRPLTDARISTLPAYPGRQG